MKLPEAPAGVTLTDEHGPRLVTADRLWRREVVAMLAGDRRGWSPHVGPPEAHAARSQEAEPAGSQTLTGPDDFDDPQPPEPPEIAILLDEALQTGAPGRILSSRWLE